MPAPMFNAQEKQRMVLSVLAGETLADAARRLGCSETGVAKWRDQFLHGGLHALENGSRRQPEDRSNREAQLELQVAELTSALGEAHLELRMLKRNGAAGHGSLMSLR
jgi:transposase